MVHQVVKKKQLRSGFKLYPYKLFIGILVCSGKKVMARRILSRLFSHIRKKYKANPLLFLRIFFEGKLSDGSKFTVFYDEEIDNDGEFYYAVLMQNWGWTRNGDKWSAPQGSRREKRGHIYVNPKRGVAVYFYPERHFNAFKVNINSKNASH